jgi:hypothetical protein
MTAIGLVTLAAASPASAQQPTITANGSADVKPEPANRENNGSIRKAVALAQTQALPLAIEAARAQELAAAANLKLGALLTIADAPRPGYPFFYSPQRGTFGDGRFCGRVHNTRTVVRNGVRRRVAAKGTHRICRVPPEVQASVQLTFATVAA